ncbi:MAG: reverse transcriptase/maturase family protein [Kiritimatiellia bacterium]
MACRIGNIFDDVVSIPSLYSAFNSARKGKKNRRHVVNFEQSLGANILSLHNELMLEEYSPAEYKTFIVREPKERVIFAPSFRDVVVQHAVYSAIYWKFDASFIDQSYGCRIGGGAQRAARQAQKYFRACSPDEYYLQLDIKKFFYSIDHGILKELVERKIKDRRLLNLIFKFLNCNDCNGVGIPIGNFLSQILALVVLNPLDHFIKRDLKEKMYVRYVDDSLIIGLTNEKAKRLKHIIEEYLHDTLKMSLSKWRIAKIKRGTNYCGYRIWQNKMLVRKYILYRFKKAVLNNDTPAIVSYLGHAKGTQSIAYMQKIMENR